MKAIEPIYNDLSKNKLLERCLGGFTQNSNESYNQFIWKLSPKHLPGGAVPVGIAAYLSACIFNEGQASILKVFKWLGVPCGSNSHEFSGRKTQPGRTEWLVDINCTFWRLLRVQNKHSMAPESTLTCKFTYFTLKLTKSTLKTLNVIISKSCFSKNTDSVSMIAYKPFNRFSLSFF